MIEYLTNMLPPLSTQNVDRTRVTDHEEARNPLRRQAERCCRHTAIRESSFSMQTRERDAQRTCILVTLIVGACGGPDDPVVEPGIIEYYDVAGPTIDVPVSASVGTPLNISVTTYGDGCISFDSTEVNVADEHADIYTFNQRRIATEETGCTLILNHIPHQASVTFASVGTKAIRIHGRKIGSQIDEPLEVLREVTIE